MTVVLKTETDVKKIRSRLARELSQVIIKTAEGLGYENSDIKFSVQRSTTTRQARLIATVELYAGNTLNLHLARDNRVPDYPVGLDILAQPLCRKLIQQYHEALRGGAKRDQLARELILNTTINGFRCIGDPENTIEQLPKKRRSGSAQVENLTLKDCAFHLNDTRMVRLSDVSARAIQLEITDREVTEDINALQQKVYGLSTSSELAVLARLRDSINNAIDLLETARKQSGEGQATATQSTHRTRRRKRL